MASLKHTLLYHFTHVDNLEAIIDDGLHSDSLLGPSSLEVDVGDQSVKQRRRTRTVPVHPGGVTADYVPFYFAPRSPMMFVIDRGGVGSYSGGLDPLVYLMTTPKAIKSAGQAIVIGDGNCVSSITTFRSGLRGLDDMIDWDVMEARYWRDTEDDPDRMRRRMAELLVHECVPWNAIARLATRTKPMLKRVKAILRGAGAGQPVEHRPEWYY